jgi:tetratricopeptide (TPR) repeat protein
LLPASAGCLVLVTSRDRLTGLLAQNGARRLSLDVLDADDSVALLTELLGADRTRAEPDAVVALARGCAHLPLALRIAGARLADQQHQTVTDYVAQLLTGDRIAALAVDDDLAVRAAFDLSYRTLPEVARLVFRRLGLVPCPDFTVAAAAALADIFESQARHALDAVTAAHLVVQHASGRYTMHDLLREYAADVAADQDSATEREAATRRLYDLLVGMSGAACALLFPEVLRLPAPPGSTTVPAFANTGAAMAWLEAERHNIGAAILHAARHGPREAAWRCADAMRKYHALRVHLADWMSSSRAGLAAARADGDLWAQAAAYHGLAHTRFALGNYSRSIVYLHRARALAVEAGWAEAETVALKNLGIVQARLGRTTEAIENLRRAYDGTESSPARANTAANLSAVYQECGRLREAAEHAAAALDLCRDGYPSSGEAFAAAVLGEAYVVLGRLGDAAGLLESALATFRKLGSRHREAHCQVWLSRLHLHARHIHQADASARAALRVADEIGDPDVRAAAHNAFGLVAAARGDHAAAIDGHRAALRIAEKVDIRHTMGEALVGLAAAFAGLGQYKAASEHAHRALSLARECGYAIVEGRALTTLGLAHHRLGEPARARDYARQALRNHRLTGYQAGEAETDRLLDTIGCSAESGGIEAA